MINHRFVKGRYQTLDKRFFLTISVPYRVSKRWQVDVNPDSASAQKDRSLLLNAGLGSNGAAFATRRECLALLKDLAYS
jgi:hypothetical protein